MSLKFRHSHIAQWFALIEFNVPVLFPASYRELRTSRIPHHQKVTFQTRKTWIIHWVRNLERRVVMQIIDNDMLKTMKLVMGLRRVLLRNRSPVGISMDRRGWHQTVSVVGKGDDVNFPKYLKIKNVSYVSCLLICYMCIYQPFTTFTCRGWGIQCDSCNSIPW